MAQQGPMMSGVENALKAKFCKEQHTDEYYSIET